MKSRKRKEEKEGQDRTCEDCMTSHKVNLRIVLMHDLTQYSTVQYSTVQYSTVQYSTVQYSTVQYSTVQYSTLQYRTLQYGIFHSVTERGMSCLPLTSHREY